MTRKVNRIVENEKGCFVTSFLAMTYKRDRYMEIINIDDYDYDLPEDRIAQYPVGERDMSNLLVYRQGNIAKDIFRNLDNYIPKGSLLVFNNTRVIRARLLFRKESGASIEILCLEPLSPPEYQVSFGSTGPVEWKCIIGNLKKWKTGKLLLSYSINKKDYILSAEKVCEEGEAWRIRFKWNSPLTCFGEVIDAAGHIPLPPYINREDEKDDNVRYQTVYSSVKGSVAAPTAGLHFNEGVFEKLHKNDVKLTELTLHVGAGTFQPVKTKSINDHEMHCEHFFITADTIQLLIDNFGKIIPVGTTSVRTLESLYWLGVKIASNNINSSESLTLGQWEAYITDSKISAKQSLVSLLELMKTRNSSILEASTSIIIIPGYKFRMINGMITNFHQPKSTLLLLISAWIGDKWKVVYKYALDNNFRFLSYGDSSILF